MATDQFDVDLESCVSISLAKFFPEIENTTEQQMEAWKGLFREKDVFAILPTGAGKSLIYQLIPSITRELEKKGYSKWKGKKFVVVVSPLLAIIETQTVELNKRGITALNLTKEMDESTELQLKNGEFDILFGSPESFVETDKWTTIFKHDTFRSKSIALVADEAHCIPKWGEDAIIAMNKGAKQVMKAFRDSFAKLGRFRSILTKTPVCVLTATASQQTQKRIVKSLALRRYIFICQSPNRLNVRLSITKVKQLNPARDLKWLEKSLNERGNNHEKTIIYCKSMTTVASLYEYFSHSVKADEKLVAMYHSKTRDHIKERVLQSLLSQEGSIRLVIATSSLGMGVNIRDIRYIIHYGSPMSLDDYIQGIGRAGRDGKNSEAILYCSGQQLGKGSKEMKAYGKSSSGCLRLALYEAYDKNIERPNIDHNCCSKCHIECKCGEGLCRRDLPQYEELSSNFNGQCEVIREVTTDQILLLKELLTDHKLLLDAKCEGKCLHDKSFVHGFTTEVIEKVIANAKYISGIDFIHANIQLLKEEDAATIMSMIHDVFEDVGDIINNDNTLEDLFESFHLEGNSDDEDLDGDDPTTEELFEDFSDIEEIDEWDSDSDSDKVGFESIEKML